MIDFPELTMHDRCDACLQHAVAIIQVAEDLPPIYTCGHHFRKNRATFIDKGYLYSVDPAHDMIFTNAFRNRELEEAGVSGMSGASA